MAQESATESKTRETGSVAPKCLLSWTVDPATGKPVARWTVAQPEKAASFTLKPAA